MAGSTMVLTELVLRGRVLAGRVLRRGNAAAAGVIPGGGRGNIRVAFGNCGPTRGVLRRDGLAIARQVAGGSRHSRARHARAGHPGDTVDLRLRREGGALTGSGPRSE